MPFGGPRSLPWGWIFLGYVVFVAYLSFYPFQFVPRVGPFSLGWYWLGSRRMLMDFTLNVWFYVPLGVLGFLTFGRRFGGLLFAVAAGVAVSLSVEFGQLYVPGRYSGLPDFAANALGTLFGALVAYAGSGIGLGASASTFVHSAGWRLPPDRALLLAFWMLGQGFPFFPDLHAVRLTDAVRSFTHFPADWNQGLQTFLGFLVLAIALRRSYWIFVAFAMIPAQTLLAYHSFSLANLIAASAAWAVGVALGAHIKVRPIATALGVALLLGVLAEELRPFRMSVIATPFGWVPFESFVRGNVTESSGSVIFSKLLLYTGSIWLLRALGWRLWTGTVAIVTTLAVGEWSQRYIPGRGPESTDIVIALCGALVVMTSWRRDSRA
jgi:VanZ family protein